MTEYSHLEDRIKSLETQNKELISKIDKLSTDPLDIRIFKNIEEQYREHLGKLYLYPFHTIKKINETIEFIKENKPEEQKIRSELNGCLVFVLGSIMKFQQTDLSLNMFASLFKQSGTPVHEKELHQLYLVCFELYEKTLYNKSLDIEKISSNLLSIKERLEREYNLWKKF